MNTMDFEKQEKSGRKADQTNLTGIPSQMKEKFEHYSGLDFSDVRVHYHSSQPLQFHADAFTRGNQIHLAPGQESHLPHELGHVVQQKVGEVPVTGHEAGAGVNTGAALEHSADRIAGRAMSGAEAAGTFRQSRRVGEGVHQFWRNPFKKKKKRKYRVREDLLDRDVAAPTSQANLEWVNDQKAQPLPANVRSVKSYVLDPLNIIDDVFSSAKMIAVGFYKDASDEKDQKFYAALLEAFQEFELDTAYTKMRIAKERRELEKIPAQERPAGGSAPETMARNGVFQYIEALHHLILDVARKQGNTAVQDLVAIIQNKIAEIIKQYERRAAEPDQDIKKQERDGKVLQDMLLNPRYERVRGKQTEGADKLILQLLNRSNGDLQERGCDKARRKMMLMKKKYQNYIDAHPAETAGKGDLISKFEGNILDIEPVLNASGWGLMINDLFVGMGIDLERRFTVADIGKKDKAAVAAISQRYEGRPEKQIEEFIKYCRSSPDTRFISTNYSSGEERETSYKFVILAREIIQLMSANYYFVNIPTREGKILFKQDGSTVLGYGIGSVLTEEQVKKADPRALAGKETKLLAFPSKRAYKKYLEDKIKYAAEALNALSPDQIQRDHSADDIIKQERRYCMLLAKLQKSGR